MMKSSLSINMILRESFHEKNDLKFCKIYLAEN